jgi:hypothetical protein
MVHARARAEGTGGRVIRFIGVAASHLALNTTTGKKRSVLTIHELQKRLLLLPACMFQRTGLI